MMKKSTVRMLSAAAVILPVVVRVCDGPDAAVQRTVGGGGGRDRACHICDLGGRHCPDDRSSSARCLPHPVAPFALLPRPVCCRVCHGLRLIFDAGNALDGRAALRKSDVHSDGWDRKALRDAERRGCDTVRSGVSPAVHCRDCVCGRAGQAIKRQLGITRIAGCFCAENTPMRAFHVKTRCAGAFYNPKRRYLRWMEVPPSVLSSSVSAYASPFSVHPPCNVQQSLLCRPVLSRCRDAYTVPNQCKIGGKPYG